MNEETQISDGMLDCDGCEGESSINMRWRDQAPDNTEPSSAVPDWMVGSEGNNTVSDWRHLSDNWHLRHHTDHVALSGGRSTTENIGDEGNYYW